MAALGGSVNLDGPEGLKDLITRFGIQVTIMEMDSYNQVFEALDKGDVDAGVTNKDFRFLNEGNFNVERSPIIFQPGHILFALTKNAPLTPALVIAIDRNLTAMKSDQNSTYYQLLEKYFGDASQNTVQQVIPEWVKILLESSGITVLFLAATAIASRHQVQIRTKELQESEAKFRSFFQENHAVMLLVDPETTAIVDANPAASAYYGWSQEDSKRKRTAEINTLSVEEIKSEMKNAVAESRNSFEF